MILMGIGLGDEVITRAYTYTASSSLIIYLGFIPVLVEVSPDSFLLDYEAVGRAINRKAKAITSLSLGEFMYDYDRPYQVLKEKKALYTPNSTVQTAFDRVMILSGSVHAIVVTYKGKKAGGVVNFTAFSFVVL